jgi:hypothetical protein
MWRIIISTIYLHTVQYILYYLSFYKFLSLLFFTMNIFNKYSDHLGLVFSIPTSIMALATIYNTSYSCNSNESSFNYWKNLWVLIVVYPSRAFFNDKLVHHLRIYNLINVYPLSTYYLKKKIYFTCM